MAGIARTLERAFAVRNAAAVALVINSPGGSPVQSHLIFRRIRELAQEKKLPGHRVRGGRRRLRRLHDRLRRRRDHCDPASIVGSIGVVGGSFGFDKLMAKLGIERRLYTAGEHKAMLDPFLPENADDVERLKRLQRDIHDDFIALVKSRRGDKLSGPENDLFSGEYWTGRRGLELGLVDAIGDLRTTLRAAIWRQSGDAADRRGAQIVRPAGARRRSRRVHAGKSYGRPCRGPDFGA